MRNDVIVANPFPGLRPFKKSEYHLFFGRENQVVQLVKKLYQTRFLAIVGASGSGKSSLVKCGLIPALNKDTSKHKESWEIVTLTPGNRPFYNLSKSLTSVIYQENNERLIETYQNKLETKLKETPNSIAQIVAESPAISNKNLLIIVDQFEEIFRFNRLYLDENGNNHRDADAFIQALLSVSEQREQSVFIVFTMRSDFLGDCTMFGGLAEAINEGQYLIPRMTYEERRRAITAPIKVAGATISPTLTERLMDDVGNNPDQLPILQHVLMRTWDFWNAQDANNRPIAIRDYEGVGTMTVALSRHAEEAYAELKTPRQQEICKTLFKGLTDKGNDNRGVRRPLVLGQICKLTNSNKEEVSEVINIFRKPGRSFLMPTTSVALENDTIIDIAHESLMRVWERLIRWVEEESQSADVYSRLAEAAELHQQGKGGLLRNPELEIAMRWKENTNPNTTWAQRYNPSYERAISFLDYSKKQYDFEITDKERRQQLRLKRSRQISIVVGIAAILALGLATYAIYQRTEAEKQKLSALESEIVAKEERKKAEYSADEARKQSKIANEQRSEAMKQKSLADAQTLEALRQKQMADEQSKIADEQRSQALKQKALAESLRALSEENERFAIQQKALAQQNEKAAIDAKNQAVKNEKDAILQRQIAENLRALERARNQASAAIQLLNNGRIDEGVSKSIEAFELNKENGGPLQNNDIYQALQKAVQKKYPNSGITDQLSGVRTIASNPKSNTFATGNETGNIRVYAIKNHEVEEISTIRMRNHRIRSMNYTPDGQQIVVGTFDGRIVLLDVSQPSKIKEKGKVNIEGIAQQVEILTLNGNTYLLTSTSNAIYLHKIITDKLELVTKETFKTIKALAVSRDNKTIVVGQGKTLNIFEISNQKNIQKIFESPTTQTVEKMISSVAISDDNKYVVAGLDNGHIFVCEKNDPKKGKDISMHQSRISKLAFHNFSDYTQLAVSSYDHFATLVDVSDLFSDKAKSQDNINLEGHDKWIHHLQYSKDGKYIITASEDQTVRIWHTRSEDITKWLKK